MTSTSAEAPRRAPAARAAPLASVIVPAWNAEDTVLETIGSVLGQTCRDFELIVIDDGSTDGTLSRLRSVHDPRMRVISYANAGLAAARNRGIEQARGEFVAFIDADDLWTPEKLELQLQALRRRPAAAVSYSWTAFIDGQGRFLFAKEPAHFEGDVYADLLRSCFIASGSNMLVRRSLAETVGGFDTTLAAAQDWDFALRIAARWPFAVVPRYQILYRVSSTTMSANARRCEEACLSICERAAGPAFHVPESARRQSLSNVKQYVAFLHLSRGTGREIRHGTGLKLAECIRLYPRTLLTRKTWNLLLTWCVLLLVPPRLHRRTVTALVRAYGRWLRLRHRDVRAVVKVRSAAGCVDVPCSRAAAATA